MSEKLTKYYQIYNVQEDYFSKPFTETQLMNRISIGLMHTPTDGKIVFEIFPVLLTDKQYNNKDLMRGN